MWALKEEALDAWCIQGLGHGAERGARANPALSHRNQSCPTGEFLPIGIGLSASGEADGQHHSVGTRPVERHAIIMREGRAWQDDIGIHPARIELSIAGLEAQQDKLDRILGVIDGFVGKKRLLTHGECGLVTGND